MASSALKYYTFFLFFILALILLSTLEVQGNTCQRKSKTWSGPCLNTANCKNQCISKEPPATFGACHRDGIGFACFCYFNC
ncbi:Defensin-like protein [Medicago truncatula]|uniref:Defensin-like protein n=1 Tax=Medicago truncatula TaxID=3880 RepID=A0A072TKW4_MEDTR|nr:Defensin-like protein [Medicago truncatula]